MFKNIKNFVFLSNIVPLLFVATNVAIGSEGTRHIAGDGVNIYFMHDKVFGLINNHPLWAIYDCGSDIKGEMDKNGTYIEFIFTYLKEGKNKIIGTFGKIKMGLGDIEKKDDKVVYHVLINEKEYVFSIRYDTIDREHMANSIIEGKLDKGSKIKLNVNGYLCPFATTGIILLVSGAMLQF